MKKCKLDEQEFMKKIMNGERDFTDITGRNWDLPQHFEEYKAFLDYLNSQEFKDNPLILNNAVISGSNIGRVCIPYAKFLGANLRKANLQGANLKKANLEEANLGKACFFGAYLGEANMRNSYLGGTDLEQAYLVKANLEGAYIGGAILRRTNLSKTNLKNVQDLERAIKMEEANIKEAIMTPKEKTIIEEIMLHKSSNPVRESKKVI